MREIKFRAWDDEENKYLYFVLFDTDQGYHISSGKFIDEKIIEQFTGLKDKNGKEIYEGDIVKFKPMKKYKRDIMASKVVYKNNCWCLEENDTYFKDNFSLNGVEITGNIHENPEFLKG